VPIVFGFHPYLRLPDAPRAEWRLELPSLRRIVTDARGVPTGVLETVPAQSALLGDRQFDEAYADVPHGARLVLSAGARGVAVCLDEGFAFAQVYAPAGDAVVCLEPMTAPPDALVSGAAVGVALGDTYRAAFRVAVSSAADRGGLTCRRAAT
jgi:galactose mutarotase-like enzyme